MTAATGRPPKPTARQLDVLRELAAGWTVKEIGARLYLSQSGVSMRLANAARALGARTPAQAVHIATRQGLLDNVPDQHPLLPVRKDRP